MKLDRCIYFEACIGDQGMKTKYVVRIKVVNWILFPTKYFIGRVTLFFANNYLTDYRITMDGIHNFIQILA